MLTIGRFNQWLRCTKLIVSIVRLKSRPTGPSGNRRATRSYWLTNGFNVEKTWKVIVDHHPALQIPFCKIQVPFLVSFSRSSNGPELLPIKALSHQSLSSGSFCCPQMGILFLHAGTPTAGMFVIIIDGIPTGIPMKNTHDIDGWLNACQENTESGK